MQDNFGSNIADILVSIGPSIQACCYEVGKEIFDEANKKNLNYAVTQNNEHYYLNTFAHLSNSI